MIQHHVPAPHHKAGLWEHLALSISDIKRIKLFVHQFSEFIQLVLYISNPVTANVPKFYYSIPNLLKILSQCDDYLLLLIYQFLDKEGMFLLCPSYQISSRDTWSNYTAVN